MPPEPQGLPDRDFSDRVFFNLLIILKGVTLAFGATVFLSIIRQAPFSVREESLPLYVAWLATSLSVTLTFVSQAMGSAHSPLRPTVSVILISFALAISEFIAYGMLEPTLGVSTRTTIRNWLIAFAVSSAFAFAFVSVVLRLADETSLDKVLSRKGRKPKTLREYVEADRRGACTLAAASAIAAFLLTVLEREWMLYALPIVICVATAGGLRAQRTKIADPEPSAR